jgi:tetratricopeptide (TPR) repeat protein
MTWSNGPYRNWRATLGVLCLLTVTHSVFAADPSVRISEKSIKIPTYELGPADPNPIFYQNESYQGAQKRVYPYALQDHLTHQRDERTYTSLELENQYVQISVLPDIGGRLFSAVDKTNEYDFFYHQHVIKPALIGMLGAWVSGGIEWCAFHHHRNTTFMPVDYRLTSNSDGSKTIWFGETERRHRMRWLIGLTLHPDKSYIEAQLKFFNRTPQPHSMLYWANVAVHVNDDYQVIFPPSVQVATYHSKVDFTHWPIAQGKYRGHDYTGVDVSWWKNSPVSNSFFAWDLQEDFMGGYDHGRQAGVVHVGNHHLVCGAKLWEWGTGSFGQAWDKVLTDDDGPYAELMVGAFSDNQPDYSWIKPHEVKTVKQYWYPIRGIGGFKNANLNGAVNLQLQSDKVAHFGFCTTSHHSLAQVVVQCRHATVFEDTIEIDPGQPYVNQVQLPAGVRETDVRVALKSADGRVLIAYQPVTRSPVEELPEKTQAPPQPKDIATAEELYLTGLRIEQIHNPRVDPLEYYREAVRRDPLDSRCNLMLGIHANKCGDYQQAEQCLRKAVARITAQYTRPRDNEVHYQLGLALRGQHKLSAAYDAFYRAAWDAAVCAPAYYQLAEISCCQGRFAQALGHLNRCLSLNTDDTRALNLKTGVLRRLGRIRQAEQICERILRIDPLDFHAMNERYLLWQDLSHDQAESDALACLEERMRGEVQSYLELASDYMHGGMWQEAIDVLSRPISAELPFASTYPMLHYYLGYCWQQLGDKEKAELAFAEAAKAPVEYCFPFRLEGLDVLRAALEVHPQDARAYYYLGNLLFDLQPEQAIQCWEQSRERDPSLGIVHRNLGWAYYHANNELSAAVASYERAVQCNSEDPRWFLELDRLYALANVDPQRRVTMLQDHHDTVVKRQDSFIREITALILTGHLETAIQYMDQHQFHAQEGRKEIHDLFVDAHLLRGLQLLDRGQADSALQHFQRAAEYPENLSVGRPEEDPRAPEIAYWTGAALQALEKPVEAKLSFEQAAEQRGTQRWPRTTYYQALSLEKLDQTDRAQQIYKELIETGRERLEKKQDADFFAKFGQQMTRKSQTAEAHLLLGQGLLGTNDVTSAAKEFQQAHKMDLGHVWAAYWAAKYD